jgi:hypothetical protein
MEDCERFVISTLGLLEDLLCWDVNTSTETNGISLWSFVVVVVDLCV